MTEQTEQPIDQQQPDRPKLRDKTVKPEGTIPKQAQTYVIVGVSIVIVLAVLFSNKHAQPAARSQRKEPTVVITEGNDKKISDFGQEMTDEQRAAQKAQLEKQMQAQVRSLESASVMQPGDTRQPIGPQYAGSAQNAPPTPPPDPIVQHERELAYNSRFASNFAFSTERISAEAKATSPPQQSGVAPVWPEAISGNAPGPSPTPASGQPAEKRHTSVNVNSAEGQPYVLFEGTELETALVNRLDGDFSGPVKVMVTNPVYSHDRQHVLIPEGTFALGETSKVQGFGQRRLAVVFHRLIMPDGYTVDLDQFHGLNQIGETGLKDQVNHHYFQIFGASIALGIIAGVAESSNSNAGLSQTGSEAYRSGIAGSVSQSSTQVLDRFLNIPPTVTIREGHRVKVYFTQDLLLPAYENHTVPPNI
jgi:type IV secretory pathway VirB10-like protein